MTTRLTDEIESILTSLESKKLLLSALLYNGEDGTTEDDMTKVLAWAEDAKLTGILLECVLTGKTLVTNKDGEIKFRVPTDEEASDLAKRFARLS